MQNKIFITIKGGYIQQIITNCLIEVTIQDHDPVNGTTIENYIPDSVLADTGFDEFKEREMKLSKVQKDQNEA